MSKPSLEIDAPHWAEPFGAMFARVRYGTWLIALLGGALLVSSILNYRLATRAAAHVYEVRPDGSAAFVADRESNVAPRPAEARFVAKRFIEHLYGWNSSTVLEDVTNAVNMCAPAMAEQLSKELATAQFVEGLRRRNIRTELEWSSVVVTEQNHREFKVRVNGRANIFPITTYAGEPIDTREFTMQVVLAVVARDPERRLNGLEVVRIERDSGATPSTEGAK